MIKEKSKFIKECDFCRTNATCLCFECNNYFWDRCFKVIHDLKNDNGHKKESIDPFMPIDIKCPEHPKYMMDLFCAEEKGNINLYLI